MCWMRSSRPSLSADCVWQPRGAPNPPPHLSLTETQYNHVMKHWGWHFHHRPSGPEIFSISSPLTFHFSILHSVCSSEFCGRSPDSLCPRSVFSALSSSLLVLSAPNSRPLSPPPRLCTFAPVSGRPPYSALSCIPIRPLLCRQFSLWQSCNVMLKTGLLLLMVELCFYRFEVFVCFFVCLFLFILFVSSLPAPLSRPRLSAH